MGLPAQVFILGLLTVFFVLMVVMASGKAIIWFVNTFHHEIQPKIPEQPDDPPPEHKKKIAAITAAIQHITGGQANGIHIENIT